MFLYHTNCAHSFTENLYVDLIKKFQSEGKVCAIDVDMVSSCVI